MKIIIFAGLILFTILSYNTYDNHNLDDGFTSFYDYKAEIDQKYKTTTDNMSYSAVYNFPIGNNVIMFSSTEYIESVQFSFMGRHFYQYIIEDGTLQLQSIEDSTGYTLCGFGCYNEFKIEKFIVEGIVINQIERFYSY